MWPTPRANKIGGYSSPNFRPTLEQAVKSMFPTPKAQNARGAGQRHGDGGESLDVTVGGQLNPTWVEWLMGFPIGWTDLQS